MRTNEGLSRRADSWGRVDRNKPIAFTFDGKAYRGFAGDTLASALLASGTSVFARSFKYHRPRGVFTAGSEEPNALVELRSGAHREPNTRATTIELFEGLEAVSQNRWPSLRFDIGAVNGLLSPLFVAGFYYKTFMWPAPLWEKLYEPIIRRAAGLGRASDQADPDRYEKAHAFCDVLVVGAGPAGLVGALAAARSGARVILCDEDFALGGRLNADRVVLDDQPAAAWVDGVVAELSSLPNVRLLPRTTVFGAYDGKTYGALERVADHLPTSAGVRQRYWKIVARRTIVATGAIERPIAFGGNDRPGVMMAGAVRSYLNRFGVAAWRRAAVFTSSDDGWSTAFDLAHAGMAAPLIIDARPAPSPDLVRLAEATGVRVLLGAAVVDTHGGDRLNAISVRQADGRIARLDVDLLAVSGGWNPTVALTTHLGGRPAWRDDISAFVPGQPPAGMDVAGSANGDFALLATLQGGLKAGQLAAADCGFGMASVRMPWTQADACEVSPVWRVAASRSKAFVDLQHDVTVDDVVLAEREGFRSIEHLKRYTTLGMATDQGKLSNVVGLAVMAELTGARIPDLGVVAARPPYSPVSIGALGGAHRGRHFRPERLTAGHDWAADNGATFTEAGQWLRPKWFARAHEADWLQTVTREVRAVRQGVGICDVSTLGKIDVQGPDAGDFLDRLYINGISTIAVGKARYGVMLREDGLVFDDGTIARLAEDHFVVSTTTANAARVMQHMEHARQVHWPTLDVQLASVTEQWAQYAVAGPRSRDLLTLALAGSIDLSDEAFPFMACREFHWRGAPVRLFRVSFSGELAYELAAPARLGEAVLRALFEAGQPFDVVAYGTEALGVMRIEKGHVAGPELNGQTTAGDLGLGRMMSKKKDFVGAVLSARPGLQEDRLQFVGVRPRRATDRLRAGAHLLIPGAKPSLEADQGHVTSAAFSPMCGQWIGLALVLDGPLRHGETLVAHDPVRGADIEVELCSPVFFDPNGERLHG
jgi:sarcosine oxidase subunit alpha